MASKDNFNLLIERVRESVFDSLLPRDDVAPDYILFLSFTDGNRRALSVHAAASTIKDCWKALIEKARQVMSRENVQPEWLRIDWCDEIEALSWGELNTRIETTKRNYFRYGIAFDRQFRTALLEMEINANAILYGGSSILNAAFNAGNFTRYHTERFGHEQPILNDDDIVFCFSTKGLFTATDDPAVHVMAPTGLNAGRRMIGALQPGDVEQLIIKGSRYLASQVKEDGRFIYGWHTCFDREINAYNSLRHASSLYSMIEAYEETREVELGRAIERGLDYLTDHLIKIVPCQYKVRDPGENTTEFLRVDPIGSVYASPNEAPGQTTDQTMAVLVDAQDEIKLGGNAVCILALVKYSEVHNSTRYHELLEQLATAIRFMQDPQTGRFNHVLKYPTLEIKEPFRIVYYDGEAAFALMRLYALTQDPRWMDTAERGFDYFIAAKHWKAHDHWLAYAVNELTRYKPERRYYEFGLKNFDDYLDFVTERITTFPTLLELMMAASQMVSRLDADPRFNDLLGTIDLSKFYHALETRAHALLNGHFWPEFAMFFANPNKIVGSFFIRHHAFRVRIDDVEHYLSGYCAYRKYLSNKPKIAMNISHTSDLKEEYEPGNPLVCWGGDVNLGRRQHYRLAELGVGGVLDVPQLEKSELRIINLECVVSTLGEQGVIKGEGGPYYYRARPETLEILTHAGISIVATANNHSGDYGPQALLQQQTFLEAVGISSVGTGKNWDAAIKPVIKNAGEIAVAVFSLDATQSRFAASSDQPGAAYLPLDNAQSWFEVLQPKISEARKQADVVLVAVHWGDNLQKEPSRDEIEVGHKIIEAGADAILGASAHMLQGIEVFNGRPIIHDAGDFLFDSHGSRTSKTGLFSLEVSKRGVEAVIFTPLAGGFGFTKQLYGNEARQAAIDFAQISRRMGTRMGISPAGSAVLRLLPPERLDDKVFDNLESIERPERSMRADTVPCEKLPSIWTPQAVPADAQIDPIKIGPITLLGIKISPTHFNRRRMLWVETFWMTDAEIEEDIRLDIRACPVGNSTMRPWGIGMDHDPCDWLAPTSQWEANKLYRDFYGLRPPYLKDWVNGELQLKVGIVSKNYSSAPALLPLKVKLEVASLPGKASVQTRPAVANPYAYRTDFPAWIGQCKLGQTWTASQLEEVTGGKWIVPPREDWYVRSIIRGLSHRKFVDEPTLYVASSYDEIALHEQSTSSRKQNYDTHGLLLKHYADFAGAIVNKPAANLPHDFPLLMVDDPIKALIELGLAARQRFNKDVVAITGTVGKSSTVNMIRTLLGKQSILASYDNYNSRVGAPALLANLSLEHDAAIVEIAQSALWMQRGPITRQIAPTIAVVTEIGLSQTSGRIKSLDDVADFKSRIFDGLTGKAIAIIGDHLACFDKIYDKAEKHSKRIIIIGESERASLRLLDKQLGDEGTKIRYRTPEGEESELYIPLPGRGMVTNALTALAVVYAMGRDITNLTKGLDGLLPSVGRLQRSTLPLSDGGAAIIIDDSWNAEVSSMINAFSVLGNSTVKGQARRIAVLGRIVHLGEMSETLHKGLAGPLLDAKPDLIVTHGKEMLYLREMLPQNLLGEHFSSAVELSKYLITRLRSDDIVLIKGSRRDSDFGDINDQLKALRLEHLSEVSASSVNQRFN